MLATIMIGIAVTDARHYLIPDGFTVWGLIWVVVSALYALFFGGLDKYGAPFAGPYDMLVGICAGAGAIAVAGWLGEVALKKEAMGFGDITLMAVVGAALGPGRALITIFLGALIGAIAFFTVVMPVTWRRSKRKGEEYHAPLIPFGVFLAPAAIVMLVWGENLIFWYIRMTGMRTP